MWIVQSVLLVLLLLQLSPVQPDVSVQYEVKNYKNPKNLNNKLRKCESFNIFNDNCDPVFHFAAFILDEKGSPVVSLRREAGPFKDLKFVANVLDAHHVYSTIPQTIEVELDVYDDDLVGDERIALFRRKIQINKTGSYEVNMGADVSVDILITVKCANEFYGDRCDIYCRPIPGLWQCNNITGSRECSKFCAQGSCQLTSTSAVCICSSGWVGDQCDRAVDHDVISSLIIPDSVYSGDVIGTEVPTDPWTYSLLKLSTSEQSTATVETQEPKDELVTPSEVPATTTMSADGTQNAMAQGEHGIIAARTPDECNTTGLVTDNGRPSNCSVTGKTSPAVRSASSSWPYQTILAFPLVAALLVFTLLTILGIIFCRSQNPWNRKKHKSILINPTYQSSKSRFPVPHKNANDTIPFVNHYNFLPKTLPTRRAHTHLWQSRSLGRHQQYPLPQTPSDFNKYVNDGDLSKSGISGCPSSEPESFRKLRFAPQTYSASTNTTGFTSGSRTVSYEPTSTRLSTFHKDDMTEKTTVSPNSYEELTSLAKEKDDYDIWENEDPVPAKLTSFS